MYDKKFGFKAPTTLLPHSHNWHDWHRRFEEARTFGDYLGLIHQTYDSFVLAADHDADQVKEARRRQDEMWTMALLEIADEFNTTELGGLADDQKQRRKIAQHALDKAGRYLMSGCDLAETSMELRLCILWFSRVQSAANSFHLTNASLFSGSKYQGELLSMLCDLAYYVWEDRTCTRELRLKIVDLLVVLKKTGRLMDLSRNSADYDAILDELLLHIEFAYAKQELGIVIGVGEEMAVTYAALCVMYGRASRLK